MKLVRKVGTQFLAIAWVGMMSWVSFAGAFELEALRQATFENLNIPTGFKSKEVTSVYSVPSFWIATSSGGLTFSRDGKTFERLLGGQFGRVPAFRVCAARAVDGQEQLVVASKLGVGFSETSASKFKNYPVFVEGKAQTVFQAHYSERRSQLYLGTYQGLVIWNSPTDHPFISIPSTLVQVIEEAQDALWVGASSGLFKVYPSPDSNDPSLAKIIQVSLSSHTEGSLVEPSVSVTALLVTPSTVRPQTKEQPRQSESQKEELIFVGTDRGLVVLDGEQKKEPFQVTLPDTSSLRVLSIDRMANTLFLGTSVGAYAAELSAEVLADLSQLEFFRISESHWPYQANGFGYFQGELLIATDLGLLTSVSAEKSDLK